jgi:hypothetical protein
MYCPHADAARTAVQDSYGGPDASRLAIRVGGEDSDARASLLDAVAISIVAMVCWGQILEVNSAERLLPARKARFRASGASFALLPRLGLQTPMPGVTR